MNMRELIVFIGLISVAFSAELSIKTVDVLFNCDVSTPFEIFENTTKEVKELVKTGNFVELYKNVLDQFLDEGKHLQETLESTISEVKGKWEECRAAAGESRRRKASCNFRATLKYAYKLSVVLAKYGVRVVKIMTGSKALKLVSQLRQLVTFIKKRAIELIRTARHAIRCIRHRSGLGN